jgi:hypothetical protein
MSASEFCRARKIGHGTSKMVLGQYFSLRKRLLHSIPRLTPYKHCKQCAVLIIGPSPDPRFRTS